MSEQPEKLYLSKAALRRSLGISQARYEQYVESNIIPKAIAPSSGARPVHLPEDVEIARRRHKNKIYDEREERREKRSQSGAKPIKPVSEKHRAQARARHF